MKKFFDRLILIDRRVIFLLISLSVIVPLLVKIELPLEVTPEVRRVFELVESLPDGSRILIPCEYAPDVMAEMEPMLYAILRQCYRKNLKVIVTALYPTGVNLIEKELRYMADQTGRKYGEDYTYLGYRPYPAAVILSMGQDFRQSFAVDFYGTPLDSLPMMKGVKNYKDVGLVLTVNATGGTEYWIIYGRERYNFPLAIGVTAVMGADYYNYLKTGQIVGIIPGLKGAAEYEKLIDPPEDAIRGMNIQSIVHLLIVVFVLIGNVGFFLSGQYRRKK